ncbi:efflux RND transporter periplasmic adaptor subunit [Mobilicoccus pelagius]|uniref:Multidrug resistance protein MdtA-like C-terminal permuted SH3 domain-containing protein n=1 Tax=Mobilicoccus pelagius NBRC 104925 TaxID=1089455 RepID=H5UP29_9MICO|nr:HlyD family efflux transporter periplasmic adaptor subunit [Mobilicoccus pelagius]GAB47487.1 hypothetical protein MOPEL_013_00280 [Mobilicoccus pelagius NBRC 104925]
METVRRYVFPLIWMLVFGVIAASLAKVAFFSDASAAGPQDTAAPAAALAEDSTVAVRRADVASTLSLPGTVRPDTGRVVKATTAGEVVAVWVKNGDHVDKGARILQVKVPREVDPVDAPAPAAPAPSGAPAGSAAGSAAGAPAAAPVAAPAAAPQFTYHTLHAPASGTVRGLTATTGQSLASGDTVATLSPGTYSATADLTPEQQLQLLGRTVQAKATIPGTRTPVSCTSTGIEEDDPEAADAQQPAAPQVDPMTGMPMESTTSAASLRCAIPDGTKVVPGLAVTIGVDLGSAKKTLVVPTTAVEGTTDDGAVYLVGDGGEPTRHPVRLGLRGEDVVQVVSGLKQGQEVLRFVPGVDNPEAQNGPGGAGW